MYTHVSATQEYEYIYIYIYVYVYVLYIYICIYVYMSWVPGFTVPRSPPGRWYGPQDGLPMRVEHPCHAAYACICCHMHEYTHLRTHIYICMHGICIQAYACMACMHLHMHAWHACIYACLIPCAPPPHIPQGGAGASPWLEPLRGATYGHLQGPPHIAPGEGGITITIPSPPPAGGGGNHWTP